MEQRLIDANAIKLEKGFFEKIDNVPKFYEWLGKQPTVDAVTVVRCGECRYKFHNQCNNPIGKFGIVTDDMYCDCGERKDCADDERTD